MNNQNSLENHLRAWKLRAPSPKLREKILNAPAPAARPISNEWHLGEAIRWFIPVAGCVALLLSGLNSRHQSGHFFMASTNMMLGVYSNGASPAAPSFAGSIAHSEMNNVPSKKLEWAVSNQSQSFLQQSVFVSDTNFIH